jgi:hypothetical protein
MRFHPWGSQYDGAVKASVGIGAAVKARIRPEAGASAQRYFKQARREYRRGMRLPLLFTLGACLVLALVIRLFSPWHPVFYAGVLLGAAGALFFSVWDEPPERIAKWGRGAEGERRTAKALGPLRARGWFVRHDVAGKYGNLDHIVVGPGGVFLLDTKNLGGAISVEDGALAVHFQLSPIDDYIYTGLPRAVGGAARGLRDRLQEKLGWIVDVYPVVVIHGLFPQRVVPAGRLTYVAVEELAAWLEEQPCRLAVQDQPAVARAVGQLPPARDIAERLAGEAPQHAS